MNKRAAAEILTTLDMLALSLPDGFQWPSDLRLAYERGVVMLKRIIRGKQ